MIQVWIEEIDSRWYGAAMHEGAIVSAAASSSRPAAQRAVLGALPAEAARELLERGTEEARAAVRVLADLERGIETGAPPGLSAVYIREPLLGILRAASSIPRGYVCTYGAIARAAGTDARTVGQVMASNPMYPLVPCHRVVGADLALVGYGKSTALPALRAKLDRLRAERCGHPGSIRIEEQGGLEAVPVEWALARAAKDGVAGSGQLPLW